MFSVLKYVESFFTHVQSRKSELKKYLGENNFNKHFFDYIFPQH